MLLSEVLIASGPITYIGCWIVIIMLLLFVDLPDFTKVALIAYAVMPVGAICQSGMGFLLACVGL
jgi:hypothetical protein